MGKDKEDIEDSSSSSSDDSSDEEEEMSVDTSEIDRLEMQVRSSPYNFAFHEQYVAALSKAGKSKFAELRTAREDLSSKFPLPEGQWLAWVRDESQAATTKEDKEKVIELYKTALTDYLSVPLQVSYAAFVESIAFSDSKGGTPDTASAKRVRDTYENGLTSVGLHMVDGARLWAAYRTFEQRVLASMAGQSEGDKNKQIEKIRALYRRQVAVPHTGIEETYADFAEWEASLTPPGPNPDSNAALQTQYKNAIAAFEERKGYEDAIAGPFLPSNPDYEKLPSWREYLAFEESKGDPSRIQCLYERVLKSYFLVADLWVYYATYLEKTFSKMPQIIYPVYARAVRNCTWSGDLWGSYIRSLEKANQPVATIEGVFETALVSGIQQENDFVAVWNSYIDFRRRIYSNTVKNNAKEAETSATQIREAFQRYLDYFTQYFAGSASVNNIILHWARLEANVLNNGVAARKQYGDYIHHHNSDYLIWSEWISCERRFGHPDMARQLYRRAAQITSMTNPDTQRVRVDWISFEREAGDIESLVSCQSVCAVQEAELYARMEAAAQQAQARAPREGKRKPTDEAGGKNKRAKPEGGSRFEDKRRKKNDEHENGHTKKTEKAEDTKDAKDTKSEEPKKKEANVVHVSNLPWKVQEPELKELFEKYGAVKGVRLPRQNDKSMGYAFVEFESEAFAQAAIAFDGTTVMNRPLRVTIATNALPDSSRSFVAPPSRRPPTEENAAESGNDAAPKRFSDENTLFVSNLPFSCTADDIKKTFAAVADAIRDVRLATDSKDGNGRCKGFGYVEFTDKEGFERGLALTGLLIKGRKINTSVAEPPKPVSVRQRRDQPDRPPKPESPADENKPVVRKGMNVPRALKLKVAAAPKKETTNKPNKEQETKETTETKETKETATTKDVEMKDTDAAAPKSNDFFKNLMKK